MKVRVSFAALLAACAIPFLASGAEPTADFDLALVEVAARYPRTGLAAGLIRNGEVAWTGVTGRQSAEERATDGTLFNVASLAKPVTAELVVRLVQQGSIDLDERMSKTWSEPDLVSDPRHHQLTPRLALSHQTGLPNWRPQNHRLRFIHDPGRRFNYSGEGYEYLARFLEKKLDADFEDLVQEHVFNLMGLRHIAYSWRTWMEGRIAVPSNGNNFPGSAGPARRGHWSAADNLYVTIGDYTRFVSKIIANDDLGRMLADERLRIHVASEGCPKPAPDCPNEQGLALGWMVLKFGSRRIAIHEGSDPGVSAMAYFDPDTRDGVVVFVNGEGGTTLIMQVIERLDPQSLVLRGFRAYARQTPAQ